MLEIFSKSEPGQLPYVVSSSFMKNANPACARAHLEQLELRGSPSVTVTLCKAAQALRLGELHYYQQQMDRHAEVRFSLLSSSGGANIYCIPPPPLHFCEGKISLSFLYNFIMTINFVLCEFTNFVY